MPLANKGHTHTHINTRASSSLTTNHFEHLQYFDSYKIKIHWRGPDLATTWQTMLMLTDAFRCHGTHFGAVDLLPLDLSVCAYCTSHKLYECGLYWGGWGGVQRGVACFPVTYNWSAVLLFQTITTLWRQHGHTQLIVAKKGPQKQSVALTNSSGVAVNTNNYLCYLWGHSRIITILIHTTSLTAPWLTSTRDLKDHSTHFTCHNQLAGHVEH